MNLTLKELHPTGEEDEQGVRSYVRRFQIHDTDQAPSRNIGPITCWLVPGLPQVGDFYVWFPGGEFDTWATCRKRVPRMDGDGHVWIVECHYSTKADPIPENPLARRPRITVSWEKSQVPIIKDVDTGKMILNSALQPFDPPAVVDLSRITLNYTRNYPFWNIAGLLQYQDAINNAIWNGFPARTVKIGEVSPSDAKEENGVTFYEVTWKFEINWNTWRVKLLDAGFCTLLDAGPPEILWVPIIDKASGQPVNTPVALDGAGGKLADINSPVYIEFKGYREIAFPGDIVL